MMLGRLLIREYPEIAENLIPYAKASAVDHLEKMPHYFSLYCKIIKKDPEQMKGKLFKRSLVMKRMIFVSCMLHVYDQKVLYVANSRPVFRNGFVSALSNCMMIKKCTAGQYIKNCLFNQETYDDYKSELQAVVIQLPDPKEFLIAG